MKKEDIIPKEHAFLSSLIIWFEEKGGHYFKGIRIIVFDCPESGHRFSSWWFVCSPRLRWLQSGAWSRIYYIYVYIILYIRILHWENYTSISFHIINPLNMIVLWCTGGFREALNWAPLMPRDASLSDSYAVVFAPCCCI